MVAVDDDLVRPLVRRGIVEGVADPKKVALFLLGERQSGTQPGMHKQIVPGDLVKGKILQEGSMRRRQACAQSVSQRGRGAIPLGRDAVALQRRRAPPVEPFARAMGVSEEVKKRLLVISFEKDGVWLDRLQRREPVENAAAVRAPVDIISQKYKALASRPRILLGDHLQKAIKQIGAPVDVAHSIKAHSSGRGGFLTFRAEKFFEHRFNKRLQSFYSMEKSGDRVKAPSRRARRRSQTVGTPSGARCMSVLVTGGAGYVGAHMMLALRDAGEQAVALDDLSAGARWLAPQDAPLIVADVGDKAALMKAFVEHDVREVIHFAGSTLVPESLERPLAYYRNNTAKTLALIEACAEARVDRFIFSSTAAVYGTPEKAPVAETAAIRPISPYGASMAMSERILADAALARGLSYVILRYFNVAGADPKGRAGEIGRPTHLLKVAAQIAVGARKEVLEIYGADYPTPDGTAIRDYVHVSDIADAHLSALSRVRAGAARLTLNVGYGRGYSVREMIEAVERVTGKPLPYEMGPRRPGDPAQLIADTAAIRAALNWRPRHDDIDFIVRTAIDWERRLAAAQTGARP